MAPELRYKPWRVKDPISDCHSVLLSPGQKFEVLLSDYSHLDETDFLVKSDYIQIDGIFPAPKGKGIIYRFSLRDNPSYEHWTKVSTTCLGEVVLKGSKNIRSRLCCFLRSGNPYKKNIVTTINPDGQLVKIQPYQIIEVVLHSPLWGRRLYWELDAAADPRMEVLSWCYINPANYNCSDSTRQVNDAFFVYPRATNSSSREPFFEYHFWLRCKTSLARHIHKLPEGHCPQGRVRFNGCVGLEVKSTCDLTIQFNPREQSDPTVPRVQVVTWEDSDMTWGVLDMSPKRRSTSTSLDIVPYHPDSLQRRGQSIYQNNSAARSSGRNWESYERSGMRGEWGQSDYGDPVRPYCSQQKMTVTAKRFQSPWEGCKVKYLDEITGVSESLYQNYHGYAM